VLLDWLANLLDPHNLECHVSLRHKKGRGVVVGWRGADSLAALPLVEGGAGGSQNR